MSSQHVRPLVAFLLVSAICAMVMFHAARATGLGPVVPHEFAFAGGAERPAQGGDNESALGSLPGPATDGFADELVQKRVAAATGSTAVESGSDAASVTTAGTRGHTVGVTSSAPPAHEPAATTPSGGASVPGSGPTRPPHAAKAKRIARAQHIREVAQREYAERVAAARTQRQLAQEKQSHEVAQARFARQIAKAKSARDAALERAREVATGPVASTTVTDPIVATPDAVSSDTATVDPAAVGLGTVDDPGVVEPVQ